MPARVHIVCTNYNEDRIIPRMARALRDSLGWTLSSAPAKCDALYLSGYFEGQKLKPWPDVPVAAYFTHREEQPPGNAKAKLFDAMAARVQLRIVTAAMYADMVAEHGPTVQAAAPLERERFVIAPPPGGRLPVVGLSGYTYSNKRKGEDLVKGMIESAIGQRVEWRASGRGWPVPTKRYTWADMPSFYQGLDVLVVPSRVEGIPMPPLEALACGVRVVVPRGVGLLDELPDVAGIYRYERGDLDSLLAALELAAFPGEPVDREALRAATAPYSMERWVADVGGAVAGMLGGLAEDNAGIVESCEPEAVGEAAPAVGEPVERGTGSARGIYCVAFGAPARACAVRMIESVRRHMPDIPICLGAAEPLGLEDVWVQIEDSDVGARRAKLMAYEATPAEWDSVLYLDADTELIAPVYQFFEWAEDGWDLCICKDIGEMDKLRIFARKATGEEMRATLRQVGTLDALQLAGGVWSFARNERTERFFAAWRAEWERWAQRDQGALLRALHAEPLRVWTLGNEWNTFTKFLPADISAGVLHYAGDARRWGGQLPGRIDSPAAWQAVRRWESARRPTRG